MHHNGISAYPAATFVTYNGDHARRKLIPWLLLLNLLDTRFHVLGINPNGVEELGSNDGITIKA